MKTPTDSSLGLSDSLRSRRKAITAEELAEMLACSTKSVYAMAKAGRIPVLRIGSLVRFDPKVTADWLEAGRSADRVLHGPGGGVPVMHDTSPRLWINAGVVSHLLSVAGKLDLSPTDMAVLLQHCCMTQVGSLETWCAHQTLCERTKLGLTAIKAALKRLEQAGILQHLKHRRNGIKLYRLHLPGLAASNLTKHRSSP